MAAKRKATKKEAPKMEKKASAKRAPAKAKAKAPTPRKKVQAKAKATRRAEKAPAAQAANGEIYKTVLRLEPKLANKFKNKVKRINKDMGETEKQFSINGAMVALIESFVSQPTAE